MKKKIIIFTIIVAALFSGIVVLLQPSISVGVKDVLPSGAVFYYHAVDLEKNLSAFLETTLAASLAEIDFFSVMKKLNVTQKELDLYAAVERQFSSEQNRMILSKLFGREIALAIYLPSRELKGASSLESVGQLLSNISFVTRLNPEVRFIEVLTAALSNMNPDIREETLQYRGKVIHLLTMEGFFLKIGYVRFGELLVFGIGDAAAKKAIDCINDSELSLAQDAALSLDLERQVGGAEFEGFFHYEKFMATMKEMVLGYAADNETARTNIQKGFIGAQGFKVFSFSGKYDRVLQGRLNITYDATQFSEKSRQFYAFSSQKNHSLDFVPRTAMLYSWNAMANFNVYWDMIREQIAQASQITDAQKVALPGIFSVMQLLSVDINDVMPLLTNELGWYFLGMELSDIVPAPKAVFFIGVSNMAQMRDFIDNELLKKSLWHVQKEVYQGIEIGYVDNIPLMNKIRPAYAVAHNYVLISTHQEFIREAIDVIQEKAKPLALESAFIDSQYGMSSNGNAVFFLNMSAFTDELKKVLNWANDWADTYYTRQQAFKAGAEKRLDDVRLEIKAKQDELGRLEQGMLDVEDTKRTIENIDPQEVEDLKNELERKEKILLASENSISALEKEETELVRIEQDKSLLLPEDGVAQLAYIQGELVKRRQRHESLTGEVDQIRADYQALTNKAEQHEDLMQQLFVGEEEFSHIRNQMKALEETETQLRELIKGYNNPNMPTPSERAMLLDELINPTLNALHYIKWIGLRTAKTPQYIRSEIVVEVK